MFKKEKNMVVEAYSEIMEGPVKKKTDWIKIFKEKSYSEIVRLMNNDSKVYLQTGNEVPMGSGNFDVYLEKMGKSVTSDDIKKLSPEDCGSLVYNIFYNQDGGLRKLVSDKVLKELISKYYHSDKREFEDMTDATNWDWNRRNGMEDYYKSLTGKKKK